ncbi:hypothetical protein P3L10_004998 [Capsicum annuum]
MFPSTMLHMQRLSQAIFQEGYDRSKSKGYGFVQFGSEDSANSAIEKLNGTMIETRSCMLVSLSRRLIEFCPILM